MQNLIRPTLFVAMTLAGALAQAGDLTIRVDNVKDAHGTVRVAMFDTADGFLKRPLREEAVAANPGGTVVVFKNLPAGDYGFAVYHDVNQNGQLDANPMGIPVEPFGFSRDAQGHMGPPAFEAVKLAVPDAGLATTVTLR